ncbi:uncharacterized protein LOC144357804 [Saccoglossus kowalevskii]
MSDRDLNRLGVATIGDRVNLRELCKAVAESPGSSTSDQAGGVSHFTLNSVHSILEERRFLFSGSRRRGSERFGRRNDAVFTTCTWSVNSFKANLGSQSKIYLRPIQKNLSTQPLVSPIVLYQLLKKSVRNATRKLM